MRSVGTIFFDISIFLSLFFLISCASGNLYTSDDAVLLTENDLLDETLTDDTTEKFELQEEIFSVPHSLDEIEGRWKITLDDNMNTDVAFIETFRYPVIISNKIYMVITYSKNDRTSFFKEEAARQEISEEMLWEKRYSIPFILGGAKTQDILPFSDMHGTQVGVRWSREFNFYSSPKYFTQKEILVPELIVSQNLNFFLLSDDKSVMKINENSKFRYFSEKFDDLTSDSNFIYKKLKTGLWH